MFKHLPGLPWPRRSSEQNIKYIPLSSPHLGHRRQVSLSSFNPRKAAWLAGAGLFLLAICLATAGYVRPALHFNNSDISGDDGPIPLGRSVYRGGREVFWWEQFPRLIGYYHGRNDVVSPSAYIPEGQQSGVSIAPSPSTEPTLKPVAQAQNGKVRCSITPPTVQAYDGLPQGMSQALLGSMEEMGINQTACYDRINRLGPYGLVGSREDGGLGIELHGDNANVEQFNTAHLKDVQWKEVQEECARQNEDNLQVRPRTAFILRTWHTYNYTPHHILMLRAMINELSLRTGGQVYIHFLIHVQDDSIPIWASEKVYNEILNASLPKEFAGMGTLWSVAQMRLVYPPPFPKSIINFSGGDVYDAYRSLHFPLQYFASQHPEFDYFWQWEMDIRVTGHYGELLDKITAWADKQPRDHLWERSSKFFIPSLYNTFANFSQSIVKETAASGLPPISGPQLPANRLLRVPPQPPATEGEDITDLITFSPLFNPMNTRWAFHNDITGYPLHDRPPTRAALITASRLSRRLLLLMHKETFQNNHTMFPEMYPASIALHYGLKAVYAPITTYFDRDWPAEHASEVFNNAKLSYESLKIGMGGGGGYFHGIGGSVFGPGEHVFRGASWYSNAGFAGYLWRRWLGNENGNDEIAWELGEGDGRMCLPMMILHPVKNDA